MLTAVFVTVDGSITTTRRGELDIWRGDTHRPSVVSVYGGWTLGAPATSAGHRAVAALAAGLVAVATSACRQVDAVAPITWPARATHLPLVSNLTDHCPDVFEAGADYFPQKAVIRHAGAFTVTYHGHYKVVEIAPHIGEGETTRFVLVQCGTPVPHDVADAHVVTVPIARAVLAKTELAEALDALQVVDRLVGVASILPIATKSILERHRQGLVQEVGSGTHSSIELAMGVAPDVVFTFYSAFADANMHPKLLDVGIAGVPVADHFEATPLGRAEWVKLLAHFFNAEGTANTMFDAVEARYTALRARAAGVAHRPAVMLGWPNTRIEWALNGGRNFAARLVADAGGRYVWDSDSRRSLDLAPFERVFDLGGTTDVWLGRSLGTASRERLLSWSPQLARFGPVARGAIWTDDKGRLPSGATPIGVEAFGRPDLLLADMIAILHPALMPGHELRYHERVQ